VSPAAWLTLLVVGAMFASMVRGVSPAVAIVGSLVVLLVSGVVDERAAFAGFANAAPLSVAALYVVARGVERTGALGPLVQEALKGSRRRTPELLRLLAPAAPASPGGEEK